MMEHNLYPESAFSTSVPSCVYYNAVDVRVLHQHIGPEDTASEDGAGGFGGSVGGTDGGEDDGDGATHGAEEGLHVRG